MNEYKDAMDSLRPTDEQRERMLMKAEVMAEVSNSPKKRRMSIKMIVIAVAAVTALLGTTTVFASEIKQFFSSFFEDEALISEDVIENVYHDTDGHVDFYVNRIVSDRMCTYAIVQYTALDDMGRKWLHERLVPLRYTETKEDGSVEVIGGEIKLRPGANISHFVGDGDAELTEPGDKNTRVFRISICADDVVSESDHVRLTYPMPDWIKRNVELDVSESIEFTEVKIEGREGSDMPYIVTGARYSPLCISVYGNKNPKFTGDEGYRVNGGIQLIMEDGTEVDPGFWSGGNAENGGYELIVCSTYFDTPIDVEKLVGFRLNGVVYELNSNS